MEKEREDKYVSREVRATFGLGFFSTLILAFIRLVFGGTRNLLFRRTCRRTRAGVCRLLFLLIAIDTNLSRSSCRWLTSIPWPRITLFRTLASIILFFIGCCFSLLSRWNAWVHLKARSLFFGDLSFDDAFDIMHDLVFVNANQGDRLSFISSTSSPPDTVNIIF